MEPWWTSGCTLNTYQSLRFQSQEEHSTCREHHKIHYLQRLLSPISKFELNVPQNGCRRSRARTHVPAPPQQGASRHQRNRQHAAEAEHLHVSKVVQAEGGRRPPRPGDEGEHRHPGEDQHHHALVRAHQDLPSVPRAAQPAAAEDQDAARAGEEERVPGAPRSLHQARGPDTPPRRPAQGQAGENRNLRSARIDHVQVQEAAAAGGQPGAAPADAAAYIHRYGHRRQPAAGPRHHSAVHGGVSHSGAGVRAHVQDDGARPGQCHPPLSEPVAGVRAEAAGHRGVHPDRVRHARRRPRRLAGGALVRSPPPEHPARGHDGLLHQLQAHDCAERQTRGLRRRDDRQPDAGELAGVRHQTREAAEEHRDVALRNLVAPRRLSMKYEKLLSCFQTSPHLNC